MKSPENAELPIQNGPGAYLEGQCIVAMPSLQDNPFTRSVVYICAHSADGAMGIILNRPAKGVNFADLLLQLDVIKAEDRINLAGPAEHMRVLTGGPVDASRGFVLHSPDYHVEDSTLNIDESVSLTATLDILRAIARNEGPTSAVLALGYAGWAAGQLEQELQTNSWLICPADAAILFDNAHESKYERALEAIGVDLAFLSAEGGHA